jgi:curved DNA-binding protein CbpA
MPSSEPEMNQISFQPKRGLSEFGYPDHYAVLGIAVDASTSEIRKRYMILARMLHPDSCKSSDKQLASQVLSKLVNPAYQVLSQEKDYTDYNLLLKLVGQRAHLELDTVRLSSGPAQSLLSASDYETLYHESVQKIAGQQYKQLENPLETVELLSELNLAFLLRREMAPVSKQKPSEPSQTPPAEPISPEASVTTQFREPAAAQSFAAQATATDSYVSQYLRRAQELADKNLYTAATQELRDALRLDPQNLRCHALMGSVYLKQNQPKMAKGHLTQAIKLDPSDAEARQGMAELQKLEAQLSKSTQAKSAQSGAKSAQSGAKVAQSDAKPAGRKGLFGLFGGKK